MIRGCPDPVQDRKPSMTSARRAYATDLTDAEWQLLAPLIPAPKPGGRPPCMTAASWSTPWPTGSGRAAPGGCCPMICRPGRPSTTTSAAGDSKGSGSRSTMCFTSRSGSAKAQRRRRARRSWTARASRPPNGGAARLRRRQEGQRPQAPPAGRHPRPDHQGPPDRGRRRRPRRGRRAAQAPRPAAVPPATARLGRRRLPRPVPGLGTAAPRHQLPGRVAQRWWPPAPLAAARRDSTDRVPVRRGATPVGGERTFAWLGRYRRLSKDYEFLTATSEAVIYLAMTRLLLRRLTRP